MNVFGKRSNMPFSRKSDHKKDKSVILFRIEKNIIWLEQAIICRQLFAGHVVDFWPMKRKNNLHSTLSQSNFWVCVWNPMMLSFKLNLLGKTFAWFYLHVIFTKIDTLGTLEIFFPLAIIRSERL